MSGTSSSNLKCLEDALFSDFTIEAGDVVFKVHKVIISLASPMLHAACTQPSFEEFQTGRIRLPEHHPEIVARVILYIYTNTYDTCDVPTFNKELQQLRGTTTVSEELTIGIKVFHCAHYLGVEGLKKAAAERVLRKAGSRNGNISRAFVNVLPLIYDSTQCDEGLLRRAVTRLCIDSDSTHHDTSSITGPLKDSSFAAWTSGLEVAAALRTKPELIVRDTIDSTINTVNELLSQECACRRGSTNKITRIQVEGFNDLFGCCGKSSCRGGTRAVITLSESTS